MNNDSTKGYSVKEVIDLMMRKILFIIILPVIGGAAVFCYSKLIMPLQYESHTSMYVKNNTSLLDDKQKVNINDLNASQSLVTTYIAVLQDDAVMEKLGKNLINKYGIQRISGIFTVEYKDNVPFVKPEGLRGVIKMEPVEATEILRINAITTDAEISAGICNCLADIAPDFLIRVVGAGSVEAIGSAEINNRPVAPHVKKLTAFGLIAGVISAIGIVFISDYFDNTIKDPEKLTQKYDKSLIGEIQCIGNPKKKKRRKFKRKETDQRCFNVLTDKGTPFQVIEAYKEMRTNLIFSLSTSDKKIFAVSSANPGDGKSTTSANLAITLSQLSNKVLIIDADMRKPVQHKIFKIKNVTGLSSVLGKMNKPGECIRESGIKNLSVMTAGPQPPNPSELLASAQMEQLITELSEKYDYIIIDTPPVNVVTDAMSIGKYVSGIMLVMRYGKTTFDQAEYAVKKIDFAEMNLLGFVLNYFDSRHSKRSYYYHYKYSKKCLDEYGSYSYGYGDKSKDDGKIRNNKGKQKKLQMKGN